MLDMKFLGGLHGVAIGLPDNKSIKNFGGGVRQRERERESIPV